MRRKRRIVMRTHILTMRRRNSETEKRIKEKSGDLHHCLTFRAYICKNCCVIAIVYILSLYRDFSHHISHDDAYRSHTFIAVASSTAITTNYSFPQ